MAASGVGAAIALAAIADELPGEIVFLGTPAEERGSGKQIMIDDGLFEGLDAALLYHPCDRNHVESYPLASEDVDVVFTGLQSHASSDPWRGKNALDALILLFTSVGLWRQQLHPTARVHGIIREGGTAANIIPDRTSAWFMIRSDERVRLRARCATASARCARRRRSPPTRRSRSPSRAAPGRCATTRVLAERFRANMAAYGIDDQGDDPNAGSHRHGQRQLGRARRSTPTSRSRPRARPATRSCSATRPRRPRADEATLLAATLVAQTAVRAVRGPGARRGGLGRRSGDERTDARGADGGQRTPSARCYHRRGAPRWTIGFEPAAPPARRTIRRGHDAAPVSGGSRGRAPPTTPTTAATSRAATAGTREFETLQRLRPADLRRPDRPS